MEQFKDDIVDIGDKRKSNGRRVTASGVADGPFVEAKEVGGGYMIVSAENYDRAVEVVRACPAVHAPGALLEIRQTAAPKLWARRLSLSGQETQHHRPAAGHTT